MSKKNPVMVSKGSEFILGSEYAQTLSELKKQIQNAQLKAAIAVNNGLSAPLLEHRKNDSEKEKQSGWGAKVIAQLAKDLKSAFPKMKGFSPRNLLYMRQFADAYLDFEITHQAVAQTVLGHNVLLLDKVKDEKQRLWYAEKTIAFGWNREALADWIKSDVYSREGKAITNFSARLPDPQSRLAQEVLKDPYCFDFFSLSDKYHERELEQGLIDHIQKTLMELGQGFAFVGRQVHLEVGDSDFYIDLLFYHLKLRCYVVVELKNTAFKPEYAGKLNFYLSAVDDIMRHPDDKPTIGMLLCKTKNNLVVEYALRDIQKPIGVSGYETKLMEKLPKELKGSLPTIEEIELQLEKDSQT